MIGEQCICPNGPMPGHYEGCPLQGDLAGKPVPIYPQGIRTHDRVACDGTACCIHNPSKHRMRTWPLNIRLDKFALTERLCVHGIGHPDPDSLAWMRRTYGPRIGYENAAAMGVHGCDGCCHGAYE